MFLKTDFHPNILYEQYVFTIFAMRILSWWPPVCPLCIWLTRKFILAGSWQKYSVKCLSLVCLDFGLGLNFNSSSVPRSASCCTPIATSTPAFSLLCHCHCHHYHFFIFDLVLYWLVVGLGLLVVDELADGKIVLLCHLFASSMMTIVVVVVKMRISRMMTC